MLLKNPGAFLLYICVMNKQFFKLLAKFNKVVLPSFTKRKLDISKASKLQLAIIGWRAFITKNALD